VAIDGVDVTLLVELVRRVQGSGPLADKVEWVLDAVRTSAGVPWAAFVSSGEDPPDAGDVELLGAPGLRDVAPDPAALHVRAAGVAAGRFAGVLVAPVTGVDGHVYGMLAGGRPAAEDGADPNPALLDLVVVLAAHLGVAYDNEAVARVQEEYDAAQRDAVHQLQEAVRPPVPTVADTELGVHYLAADPATPTGGDLYDWQLLPDGQVHLAVVDVMGKGVAATKDALTVTHAVRMLVFEGTPLGEVVARADKVIGEHHPELVATLVVGRYDPATGLLRLAGGGHPPPLLVTGDGKAHLVDTPGIPLGFPGAGSDGVIDVTLERSDTVVLYTDGLIEASKDIERGLEALCEAGQEVAAYPAGSLAQALVERALAGAQRRDDTVALVLRRRIPPAPGAEQPLLRPFRHAFTATPPAVPIARHLLGDWLRHQPMDDSAIDDLMLVAGELCAMAVRVEGSAIVLGAAVEGDAVVLTITDGGGALPASAEDYPSEAPDPLADSGRGAFLVRTFCDVVEVVAVDGRTEVRCVKRAVMAPGDPG
jgi:serine phosphatase RsbU (regulator of sigma subunit)/anti-sigma regulatory factor (Ser/Thr protein kinase)